MNWPESREKMNLFTKQFMKFTGCSYEYAVAVWYGMNDNMRKMPAYAAEIKAKEYKFIKVSRK